MASTVAAAYDRNARSLDDFLAQVGHTAGGKPIARAEFDQLSSQVVALLDLQPQDRLLDLCCGNGFLTSHLSPRVAATVGVDFSAQLVEVARRHHAAHSEEYHVLDVLRVGELAASVPYRFDKISLYAALQHIPVAAFATLLGQIGAVAAPRHRIVFGFVPERGRRWHFYDTTSKRLRHLVRLIRGTELIGSWWSEHEVARIAARFGYSCRAEQMPPGTGGAHYRFNLVLDRQA